MADAAVPLHHLQDRWTWLIEPLPTWFSRSEPTIAPAPSGNRLAQVRLS
jgi:hypothetical protein